ncbi:MAG TPA: 50S ribosomal protein L21e [Candidatus Nanoarchaeia archaeon]|nr:50S ribosomal protein L21e [Candidatus Nanoarchaeia archaeon]
MAQRTGGPRRKTRDVLRKNVRDKGKLSISHYLQQFSVSDKVAFVAESAVQKGMHHRRFQGHIGIVVGKQGACYKVKIKDGNLEKFLIVHPVHLRRQA